MTLRIRTIAAAAAVSALLLSSCAIEDETTPAPPADGATTGAAGTEPAAPSAAEPEDSLVVACGNQEDVCQAWVAAFEEKTGVATSYVRLASGEAVARLESAKSNPEFDVWHGGPVDGYNVAAAAGLLDTYNSPAASEIDPKYMDPDGYWGGIYVGVLGFCSNQAVQHGLGVEAPKTWDDLLDPKLKGQIMMAHPATSGTAFTTLWTQVVLRGGEDQALDWMRQLHGNILQYTKSGSAPAQSAGRGEVATSIVFSHDCVKYEEQGMTDLVTTIPSDGTGWEIGGVALIKGAQHPNAAKLYYDWALSAEAQEIGPKHQSYQLFTNPNGAPDERMVNLDEVTLVDYDFKAAAEAKESLTARFDEEIAAAPKE
ncbi:MAG: ABC transporter substrate-binding protein [Propionibacteriaceae bacterium]|nr:ABC transporter substrate-binding protein [Propionibacteriaceae bacterium]